MSNFRLVRFPLALLLFINFLHNSLCGICELCVCTEKETTRILDCEGKSEIDNYTEIFDQLAFVDRSSVEKLILSKHEIVYLPMNVFRNLKLLKSLDLSENSIVTIEADVFNDFSILEELDFSFNRITVLSGAVFNNVQSLLRLNLSNNQITDLNEATANQLPKLTHLDLSHNNLLTIDSPIIASLSNLELLDISFNAIGSISGEAISKLRSLRELRASNNKLKQISGEDFPESLEILSVGCNAIASLPKNLSQIRRLNIEDNKISSIRIDADWFGQLEHLNISGNALVDFPEVTFENLTTLDTSRNRLSVVPQTLNFDNLPMLEELSIGGNPMKKLSFKSELRLRKLVVRSLNLFEAIEAHAFRNIRGVDDGCVDLIVSGNRHLEIIEKGAFDGIEICSLDLSENALTGISAEVIKSADKFVAQNGINLQNNPFNCDCKSQWMLDDLVPYLYKIHPELLEDLRCMAPVGFLGTRMVHWYKWKKRVFCDTSPQVSSKIRVDTAAVSVGGEKTIRLESSRGMLAVVVGALGTLCLLIIVGILIARRVAITRRHRNRRF